MQTLMAPSPSHRPSAKEASQHRWVQLRPDSPTPEPSSPQESSVSPWLGLPPNLQVDLAGDVSREWTTASALGTDATSEVPPTIRQAPRYLPSGTRMLVDFEAWRVQFTQNGNYLLVGGESSLATGPKGRKGDKLGSTKGFMHAELRDTATLLCLGSIEMRNRSFSHLQTLLDFESGWLTISKSCSDRNIYIVESWSHLHVSRTGQQEPDLTRVYDGKQQVVAAVSRKSHVLVCGTGGAIHIEYLKRHRGSPTSHPVTTLEVPPRWKTLFKNKKSLGVRPFRPSREFSILLCLSSRLTRFMQHF